MPGPSGEMRHDWLYSKVRRVPEITDEQIAEMRHIEPVLRAPDSCMYRRIKGADKLHPRDVSFIWNAEPTGGEFAFDSLNATQIITQHHSAVFFKPSLAEVYAWIRVYLGDNWRAVRFFCMGDDVSRIGGSSDMSCNCTLLGGDLYERGDKFVLPSGAIGHKLKAASSS